MMLEDMLEMQETFTNIKELGIECGLNCKKMTSTEVQCVRGMAAHWVLQC